MCGSSLLVLPPEYCDPETSVSFAAWLTVSLAEALLLSSVTLYWWDTDCLMSPQSMLVSFTAKSSARVLACCCLAFFFIAITIWNYLRLFAYWSPVPHCHQAIQTNLAVGFCKVLSMVKWPNKTLSFAFVKQADFLWPRFLVKCCFAALLTHPVVLSRSHFIILHT